MKSIQGTKFRQWATARLREYIVKGFTLNDDLLKKAYNLRSSVVYGSNTKGNKIKFKGKALIIDSVVSELTKIMRKTLRSYIQDFNDLKVSYFIKHIDNTIISGFKKDM